MDKNRLSQLYYLNREIEMIIDKINKLKFRQTRINNCIGDCKEIEDEMDILTQMLKGEQKKGILEQMKLENFINTIEDSQMRMIISLRYINGLSWQQIAFSIGEYDESYPRKKHNKFLKDCSEEILDITKTTL